MAAHETSRRGGRSILVWGVVIVLFAAWCAREVVVARARASLRRIARAEKAYLTAHSDETPYDVDIGLLMFQGFVMKDDAFPIAFTISEVRKGETPQRGQDGWKFHWRARPLIPYLLPRLEVDETEQVTWN